MKVLSRTFLSFEGKVVQFSARLTQALCLTDLKNLDYISNEVIHRQKGLQSHLIEGVNVLSNWVIDERCTYGRIDTNSEGICLDDLNYM